MTQISYLRVAPKSEPNKVDLFSVVLLHRSFSLRSNRADLKQALEKLDFEVQFLLL